MIFDHISHLVDEQLQRTRAAIDASRARIARIRGRIDVSRQVVHHVTGTFPQMRIELTDEQHVAAPDRREADAKRREVEREAGYTARRLARRR